MKDVKVAVQNTHAENADPQKAFVWCGESAEDIVKISLFKMGLIDDLSQLSDEDATSIFFTICYAFVKRNK